MAEVKIWTQAGCPQCTKVKEIFVENGYEEREVSELLSGDVPNDEAMVQLAMQDMQLPLVMVDGEFVNAFALLKKQSAA